LAARLSRLLVGSMKLRAGPTLSLAWQIRKARQKSPAIHQRDAYSISGGFLRLGIRL
jgi:hypothetical protein